VLLLFKENGGPTRKVLWYFLKINLKKNFFDEKVIDVIAETLIDYRSTRGTKTIQENIKAFEERVEKLRADTTLSDKRRAKDLEFNEKKLAEWKALMLDKESLSVNYFRFLHA
jgi:hypothetical protein